MPTRASKQNGKRSELPRLKNIGPTIERRLNSIGIYTKDELKRVGAARAYRFIVAANPDKTMPVCYYLYSLEGALRGVHWDNLPFAIKAKLMREAEKR